MSPRRGAVVAVVVVVASVVLILLATGDSSGPASTASASPARQFGGARESCSTRSEANFPGAFTNPANLVVGPLVMSGGTYTDPQTVRAFGGNKFPLLVESGHRVTVRLTPSARRIAGLAYGPLPQGETTMRDTYRTVTFTACRPGGPSGSHADGVNVTFWSGFVMTRRPACIRLEVYVDDEVKPRPAGIGLGRRCRTQALRNSSMR
jgi:hypothetical protein